MGEGADITDAVDQLSQQTRGDPLEHWAPGTKSHWISIVNPHFSGRRLYKPVPSTTFY